ncbi:MAG: hypothetical protein FJ320_01195 [SAR202 cluster bacterium]|nr:hypothetical protein [SAR202 cluster bacterium]
MRERNDIIRQYCSDLLSLDRQILDMLKNHSSQQEVLQYPEAHQLVGKAQQAVGRVFMELEQNLTAQGGDTMSPLKVAMNRVTGMMVGMAGKAEGSEKCSKVLRNTYASLDAASLGAMMLHTTALAFNLPSTAEVASKHFRELAPIANEARDMIPGIVVKEFVDQGYQVDTGAAEEVKKEMQQVWVSGGTS